jgi:protein ImuA
MSSAQTTLRDFPIPSRPTVGTAFRASGKALRARDIAGLVQAREGRWQPGLAGDRNRAMHSEIFAGTSDASGAGLALALACDALEAEQAARKGNPLAQAQDNRSILWVQDRAAIQRTGRPYLHGLPADLRHRLIHVAASSPEDALFALEEGLRCRDLAFVMGEIAGNPRALDFTASRRLSLTAEKHSVPLWLVRLAAEADLSSARMRWRVEASPSTASLWDAKAPGDPIWQAELFRARAHIPGEWMISNADGRLSAKRPTVPTAANTADYGDLARPTVGRSLAAL